MNSTTSLPSAAQKALALVKWVEQNKILLASIGTGVVAILHGVSNGVDPMTLLASVVTVFGGLTHMTVTPSSNPKAMDGTPLVPLGTSASTQVGVPGGGGAITFPSDLSSPSTSLPAPVFATNDLPPEPFDPSLVIPAAVGAIPVDAAVLAPPVIPPTA